MKRERVRFSDLDGVAREQSALLVLELEDGAIRRLVCFPARQH